MQQSPAVQRCVILPAGSKGNIRAVKRRHFIALLGGAAAAWPTAARAQQPERMLRIGIIVPANSTDMKFGLQVQAFEQELKKFGWLIGRKVSIELRWA